MIFVTSIDQYLIARFIQGTSICFISTVGYVSIQEAFDEKESIRIMAALTSIVLLAPVIGPAGAGLMNFLHWKLLFAIIGAMSLLAWALLIFNMPETVTSQGRGFVRERYFPSLSAPLNSRWCSRARWRCHSVTCR